MDPTEAEILGSLGDTSARDGGGETTEAEAARQAQANRETSTFAGTLEEVTLEDVAVHFSADEWSLLEGWQKALHQEVMRENYTLLLSLGHSVPSEELPSFIHQLEGTWEGQALGIDRDGGSDAEGEELFLAEEAVEAEGPWELDCLSNEGCLTPGSGGEGDCQSSLHLCALMKLVKEIPEFLYGHGKASADSSSCSDPGAAEVLPQHVKAEAHPENLHHGRLEADLAGVSLSLSSHPDTPTSSAEGDCAESRIRALHIPGEVKSLSSREDSTKSGAESRSGTPGAPARDSPPDRAPGDMDLRGAKSGVGKGILGGTDLRDPDPDACHRGRPSSAGTPLSCASSPATSPQGSPADPDRQTLLSTRKEGRANRPDRVGILGSACFSSPCSTGERLLPQAVGKRACQERVSRCTSPNPAPEAAVEEKPLQGLLRSLRELIVQQPPPSHQAACRPSTGDGQPVPRRRRRDVGSGSPPRPVKTEVADEEQRSSRRDSSDSSAQPEDSSTSISGPAGGRREHASEAQASSLFVAVKTEPTPEEEPPLPGAKELLEGCRLQPRLPRSSTSYCGTEARMELGLWVPYSEEWRPVTSPLHGLLNCLKEIPTPRPHPSNILAGRRGGGGGGGKDRRKGGRRGRPETLLENLLPPGPEGGLGEMPTRQPQLPNPLPSSPTSSSLRHDTEWRKPEAELAAGGRKEDPPSKCTSPAGSGTPLQGLERCLKELPPSSRKQPYSPAVSSSLSSSPDPLLRWTPETGKWLRKEEGPQSSSTPLQGLERCLKELPSHAHNQPPSPAIGSSFSSSPDGLQRWMPEMGKWTRKEEGLSRSSTPLQGLGRCWKEPSPNTHSQPCSPALSSSISSSPDGLHRWTLETGKWTRKEEGVSPSSTPLPGPESRLKGLPGTPHSPLFGPAVGSSSEEHCAPEAGRWSLKEEGPRSPRVSPLQGLENCLREIPTSGRSVPDSAHAPSGSSSQKLQRAEAASPRPWAGGDPAGSLLQCPTSTRGPADASVGRSPLLTLMSCLKGIPIQRPSYLDTPSISSSSSSCSDAERDPQSPGSGAWWDCSSDTCQGLEVDVAVESRRTESPATLLPSPKERIPSTPDSEPPLAMERGVAATSPLHGLENCLKEVAVSQLQGTSISPARADSHREPSPRGSEAGVLRACSARSPPTSGLPGSLKDPTAGGPGCSKTQALDGGGRKWGRAVERSYLGAGPAEEGLTNSSPLQGLLRCLREITVGGSDPHSSSASDARGETRPTRTEEEADPRRPSQEGLGSCWKERPRSRASLATAPLSIPGREKARRSPPPAAGSGQRGVIPTSSPACGVGVCATGLSGSGSLCVLSRRAPMPKPAAQRWQFTQESSSPRSGSKRSLMAVRTDDPQAVSCRIESPEKGSSHEAEPENPPKKRCPALELPLPLPRYGWEQHAAGVGGLGPALSQKLDRLSTEMSALCRDVSRLQTHMDRLEQDTRGWVLELAALRVENRGLSEHVRRMESRCRTLENRSRRNNLRLLGLPEGVEGSDAVSFLQETLPALLGLPLDPLEIESARRVQAGVPWDPNGRPRPLVFRLLRFANKAAILQAARRQPLSYAGTRLTVLPDFSSSLLPRRRVPFGAVRRTRWAAELCFGPRHSSCGCAWTREPGGLLPCPGPLAGEREGRGPKGTGTEKWGTATLEGPGQPGLGPSTGSFEQHNPTHK